MILFGSVQVTMLFAAIIKGERLGSWQWLGFAFAVGGLSYLMLSGRDDQLPPHLGSAEGAFVWNSVLAGSVLMFFAGVAWGWYSLAGRKAVSPIKLTSQSFVRTLPFCMLLFLVTPETYFQVDFKGLLWAILSGRSYVRFRLCTLVSGPSKFSSQSSRCIATSCTSDCRTWWHHVSGRAVFTTLVAWKHRNTWRCSHQHISYSCRCRLWQFVVRF